MKKALTKKRRGVGFNHRGTSLGAVPPRFPPENKESNGGADDVGSRYNFVVSVNVYQNPTTKSLPRRWIMLPKERDEVIALVGESLHCRRMKIQW